MSSPQDPKKLGAERTVPWERTPGSLAEGLTKREWFAAIAMQGVAPHFWHTSIGPLRDELLKDGARAAVQVADALLAELAKVQP